MDIRDSDALVAAVRLRLPELSPHHLAYLGSAVRAEQESRQWPVMRSTPLQPRTAVATVGAAVPSTERWRTTVIIVNRFWPGYRTPWFCNRCGAEWCRIREPPGDVPQTPLALPPA